MFTGILDNILTNDDYLAIVLGHEMAHAVLGHSVMKTHFLLPTVVNNKAHFYSWNSSVEVK